MNNFWKVVTPLVLLVMAGLVFFERWLPGADGLAAYFGKDGVLRFVAGVLCIYVMLLVVERQRLDARFTQVLATFKQFYAARAGAAASGEPGGVGADLRAARRQALPILLAALEAEDPEVRRTALENLRSLTGKDHGEDPAAWRQELLDSGAPPSKESPSPEPGGPADTA